MKQFFSLLFTLMLVGSCQSTKGTKIVGKINGAENMSVFVDRITLTSNSEILMSEKAGTDGSFSFDFPEGIKAGIYRLRIGEQMVDLILDGKEKEINIGGNLSDLNNYSYTLTGSTLSEEYLAKVKSYLNREIDAAALTEYTSVTSDPLIGFMIGFKFFGFRTDFLDLHKKVSARMNEKYPTVELTNMYSSVIGQIEKQYAIEQASAKIKVGEMAPDIALPGPDGKVRKLSDYRGKVVLIDFWASWCGPCRKANPHVVEVYDKYKKKGFDVFSVSLDGMDSRTAQRFNDPSQLKQQEQASKERWLAAIQQDNLKWDGHVSDLKKWESAPAAEYGVRSIPQTFLVDREGKIAVINPRYNLEEEVQKFL